MKENPVVLQINQAKTEPVKKSATMDRSIANRSPTMVGAPVSSALAASPLVEIGGFIVDPSTKKLYLSGRFFKPTRRLGYFVQGQPDDEGSADTIRRFESNRPAVLLHHRMRDG